MTYILEDLIREYGRYVRLRAYRIVRNDADADDVAQLTWMRVDGALAGFRGDANVRSWLHCVATTTALDFLRRRKRQQRLVTHALSLESAAALNHPDLACVAPDEHAARREALRAAGRAVAALAPCHRDVLHRFAVLDMSIAEVARSLNIPVGTAKSRVNRARVSIRAARAVTAEARGNFQG